MTTEAGVNRPQVFTFYSYKGGVGRSMTLASVATLLSAAGHRVLVVDWDLEAPGIEHYFLDANRSLIREAVVRHPGIVDMAHERRVGGTIDWRELVQDVPVHPSRPPIGLITAGRRDEGYLSRMQSLDWEALFVENDFGTYLETLRLEWTEAFDFVLIDSRTGVTDIGGICTINLPDVLITLLAANQQSLEGTADVVRRARRARSALPFDRGHLVVVPVLARDESRAAYELARRWRTIIARSLDELYQEFVPTEVTPLEALELLRIPNVPHWSFGERIPSLEESEHDPDTVTFWHAVLAGLISSGLRWDTSAAERASRSRGTDPSRLPSPPAQRVFLSHTSELRNYPTGRSFVAAAESAIARAGQVVLDMAYFVAREGRPASNSTEAIARADIYVGIIGFQYGATVVDRPELSYVELEFETATRLGLPRLVFLLDEDVELPIPVRYLIDRDYGQRQDAFRQRLMEVGMVVLRIASPEELEIKVFQALLELTQSRRDSTPWERR